MEGTFLDVDEARKGQAREHAMRASIGAGVVVSQP